MPKGPTAFSRMLRSFSMFRFIIRGAIRPGTTSTGNFHRHLTAPPAAGADRQSPRSRLPVLFFLHRDERNYEADAIYRGSKIFDVSRPRLALVTHDLELVRGKVFRTTL